MNIYQHQLCADIALIEKETPELVTMVAAMQRAGRLSALAFNLASTLDMEVARRDALRHCPRTIANALFELPLLPDDVVELLGHLTVFLQNDTSTVEWAATVCPYLSEAIKEARLLARVYRASQGPCEIVE